MKDENTLQRDMLQLIEGKDINEVIPTLLDSLFAISLQIDYQGQIQLANALYNLSKEIRPSSELLQ